MTKFVGIALLILVTVAGYLAYSGAFYPTGRQYYEVCWEKWDSGETRAAHASDPYRDVIWSNCETIARRVIFEAGMILAGSWSASLEGRAQLDRNDADDTALLRACPGEGGDLFVMALDHVQRSGGPNIVDAVTPAEWMVGRGLKSIWPDCDAERRKQGYPKMVEKNVGAFDWAQPCAACEAREQRKREGAEEACRSAQKVLETEEKRWTGLQTEAVVVVAGISSAKNFEYAPARDILYIPQNLRKSAAHPPLTYVGTQASGHFTITWAFPLPLRRSRSRSGRSD